MLRRLAIMIGVRAGRGLPHFDKDYYAAAYPDVAAAGLDPLAHFLKHGWREGRNPSWGFHTLYYRDKNPSCGRRENPLLHYAANKHKERLVLFPESDEELIELQKRVVAGHFDAEFYRLKYLGGDLHAEPLDHYLRIGWSLGFDPSADFSTSGYLEANAHARAAKVSPLYHHVATRSMASGAPTRAAAPLARREEVVARIADEFDAAFYLRANPDVDPADFDPLDHYVDHGWREGRDPNAAFWTSFYLSGNPDVRASGENPLYHFIVRGRGEGRKPNPIGPAPWPRPKAPSAREWDVAAAAMTVADAIVDVVIPVYRGYDDTLASIHAVLANAQQTPFNLLVVNDRSPDAALTDALRGLHARGLFDYVENDENIGFVRTVNRALERRARRDVVILNSDTVVHGDWIDRLLAHARSDARIATITPFSNNATISSYPAANRDNLLALEASLAALDDFAKICNKGARTIAPTGVGFCMYMRGAVIDEIGAFDAETFGRGYGEENDFCMRAARAGYVNVLAHDVFVYHTGQVSFAERAKTERAANQLTLNAKHPDYPLRVALYVRADPALEARLRLDLYRLAQSLRPRVAVMVTHAIRGGVATHIGDLATRLRAEGFDVLLMKLGASRSDDIRIEVAGAQAIYAPSLGALSIARHAQTIEDFISWLRPEIFHVHSFVGLDWPATTSLMSIITRAAPGFYCTLHDYTALCHRHHLVTPQGAFCAEREVETCRSCARADKEHAQIVDPAEREARYGAFYAKASRVFVPSRDTASRIARAFPNVRTQLRPHEYAPPAILEPQLPADAPLRLAVIGAITVHKGAQLLHALALDARLRKLPIQFRIIGSSTLRNELEEEGVCETGHYPSDDVAMRLLGEFRPHLVFFPAMLPETFCYALSLALAAGVPPVVFDIGALAERLREADEGHILDMALAAAPSALNDALLALPLEALWEKRRRYESWSYPRLVEDYYGGRA
ncbi:glycosyltransferase [Methylosinus sp. Sm6]|uniref:glycosyltransferase n=1 Tax=Methylosinus sp. Sm6 TaxID=2866948 RepID=UPI001C9A0B88|nr:glycosyltransferase [Methylosinus sp. Sm6]MBY6242757.1 glycosyltransferase [Methylosinus sp. Sm6]